MGELHAWLWFVGIEYRKREMRMAVVISVRVGTALLMAGTLLTCLGCVERRERLTISPEGRVLWQVTHTSDSADDLLGVDAVPRLQGGWLAEQTHERTDEGTRYRLTAEMSFAARSALPANYATPSDLDADLYLQFPTTVKLERRRDGMYYHFARRIEGRAYAMFERLREELLEKPVEALSGVEPAQWSPQQRLDAVHALAAYELAKTLHFAREAIRAAAPHALQDGWLFTADDLRAYVRELPYAELITLLEPQAEARAVQGQPAPAERRIDQELANLQKLIDERLQHDLRTACGLDGPSIMNVMAEYDRNRKRLLVTEDLLDDRLVITVEMPGEIVASNAPEQAGREVTWTIKGDELRDRDVELLVTSVVR